MPPEPRPGSEIDPIPAIFGANFASDIVALPQKPAPRPQCNSDYEDGRGGRNGPSDEIDPNPRPRPIDYADETQEPTAVAQPPEVEPEPIEYPPFKPTPEQLALLARLKSRDSTNSNISVLANLVPRMHRQPYVGFISCPPDDKHAKDSPEIMNTKEKLKAPEETATRPSGFRGEGSWSGSPFNKPACTKPGCTNTCKCATARDASPHTSTANKTKTSPGDG